jgi:branched-subunit amino acid aminotransferase/4-amino-4-deoxychorismate lyase
LSESDTREAAGAAAGAEPGAAPDVPLRETCRFVSGRVPLWPYHRRRLASGGCGADQLARADAAVEREAAGWRGPESSRLRLTLIATRDGGVDARTQRRLSSLDVPGGPAAVPVEVAAPPELPRGAAKPADRSWWDAAQRRARAAGADQALVAVDGLVIDGGTATVWAAVDGALLTPAAPAAVAGVARAFLLDALAREGVPVRVGELPVAALDAASELFLTNAFAGAVAIRGRGGPLFAEVAEVFARMWRS